MLQVYADIQSDSWSLSARDPASDTRAVLVEGGREDPDELRHQLTAMLEMLCFLRQFSNDTYRIFTNSTYCINASEKWIPKWVENGFRVNSSQQLRPNTDLLVKMYAFRRCVEFELCQHYDDYEAYQQAFAEEEDVEEEQEDEEDVEEEQEDEEDVEEEQEDVEEEQEDKQFKTFRDAWEHRPVWPVSHDVEMEDVEA